MFRTVIVIKENEHDKEEAGEKEAAEHSHIFLQQTKKKDN